MHLMPLLAYCASRHEKNKFGLVIIISVRAFVFSTFYSAIVLWKILLNLFRVLPKNNLYWTLVKGLLSEIYMHFVNACELNLCSDENEPAPSARRDLRQTGVTRNSWLAKYPTIAELPMRKRCAWMTLAHKFRNSTDNTCIYKVILFIHKFSNINSTIDQLNWHYTTDCER
jgi:hypothetical protein